MATHALNPAAVPAYRGGLYEWLTTTDHKKIGILYVINSFLMFFIGGVLALVVRDGARPAGPPAVRRQRARLQRGVLHPRHRDDLPVHHPDAGGPRELRRAADDRRAGHGLPADQRAVVLDAAPRRDPAAHGLLRARWRGRRRLDELPAADRGDPRTPSPGAGQDLWIVVADPDRHELDPRRHQLPGHDLQDAGAGDDAVPHADHGLDDPRDERPRGHGDARSSPAPW